MNAHRCCQIESPAGLRVRRLWRRSSEIAGWILPSATLALLPKCPACLAAYLALATGVGVSVAAATYMHSALVILCASLLAYLAAKRIQGLIGL